MVAGIRSHTPRGLAWLPEWHAPPRRLCHRRLDICVPGLQVFAIAYRRLFLKNRNKFSSSLSNLTSFSPVLLILLYRNFLRHQHFQRRASSLSETSYSSIDDAAAAEASDANVSSDEEVLDLTGVAIGGNDGTSPSSSLSCKTPQTNNAVADPTHPEV